jgi:leader peptidase (prepilin peptidase)/N-methyltransferase
MAFLFFIFGAIVGSFLNVVILRLPSGRRITGRSACPHCGHVLRPWELIPLLSYIFLKGQCSSCKTKISSRYFLIEALTGLLFLVGWLVISPHALSGWLIFVQWLVLASATLVVFVIDLEHYIILDSVVFSTFLVILLLSAGMDLSGHGRVFALHSHFVSALLAAIAGAAPFFLVWGLSKGKWMGFGDVKLMLMLGAAAGLRLVPMTLLLAIFLGGLVSIYLLLFTKLTLKSRVPFGTFLTVSSLVVFLWGEPILRWYLGMLGF